MSVERIKKIECIALKRKKDRLLEILQDQGSVHITNIKESLSGISDIIKTQEDSRFSEHTGLLGQIEFTLNYIKRFDTSEKGLIQSLKETPLKISREEIQSLLHSFDIEGIIKTCHKTEKKLYDLDTERQELNGKIQELSSWLKLNVPLKDIVDGTRFLCFYAITIPNDRIDLFKKSIYSMSSLTEAYQVSDLGVQKSFLIIALRSDQARIEDILHNFEVHSALLPSVPETPMELTEKLNERIKQINREKKALRKESKELLADLNRIKILYDHYQNNAAKEEIQERFGLTEQTLIITGWIKQEDIDTLKSTLDQSGLDVDMETLEVKKNEAPPVVLRNNFFSSPFELVTRLYDLPHYRELDPTPILAPFFFLFFGLCMTDLGYGLIIALGSLWGLKNLYLKGGAKKLLQLFFLCGISTFICGLLAGSWFGDIVNYLPASLGFLVTIKNTFAILDPIKDPLKFLILALTLGFIQVVTGIFVQMYKDIKAKDYYTAFLRRLPWVILLSGLILLVISKDPGLSSLFKWISIISALTICIFEGKSERNVLKRIGTGLLALYSTIGYYADMLSYCRLLALGLATAVIASVVNQMAILSRGIPYIGIVFMVGILIGGHIFNILINLLGAFVHTSRLQFVEFFTKFFEGGGKAFIPFARRNKYTLVE